MPVWFWYVQPRSADDDGSRSARSKELLVDHSGKAGAHAATIANLLVNQSEATSAIFAARWHDLGKHRRIWQRSIGNTNSEVLASRAPDAPDGGHVLSPRIRISNRYHQARRTCRSLRSAATLASHLIAAHHGRSRPHFPSNEAFDPGIPNSKRWTQREKCPEGCQPPTSLWPLGAGLFGIIGARRRCASVAGHWRAGFCRTGCRMTTSDGGFVVRLGSQDPGQFLASLRSF